MNRRRFIKNVAVGAGAASLWTAKSYSAVQGANERLRIGVIGCGGMANNHMDALVKMKDSDNIEITAVCDVYKKRLDAAVTKTGGKPYPKYLDVLKQKDVDYVLIATPEHWHHQMVLDALDAGKHVYVEKPMTHTIEQSKEVLLRSRNPD